MRRLRRPMAAAAVLLATTVSLSLAGSASAVPAPIWPVRGHQPTCDDVQQVPGGGLYALQYTDDTWPSIGRVTFDGRTRVVVAPRGTDVVLTARMRDRCSGVQGASVVPQINRAVYPPLQLVARGARGDWFDVRARYVFSGVTADLAGRWRFRIGTVYDRFSSFVLDQNHRWVDGRETDRVDGKLREIDGPTLLVLRKTRVDIRTRSTTVPAGRRVTVRGHVEVAGSARWRDLAGIDVELQQQGAGGRWNPVATATTSAKGFAVSQVRVRRDVSLRWVVPEQQRPGFSAASRSPHLDLTVN